MDIRDDDARASSTRRLVLSQENFDDYMLALMAKLRIDPDADRLLSGETQHPLVQYQHRAGRYNEQDRDELKSYH